MGDYEGLRSRLQTDDPYSPGNALEKIVKMWAKWRLEKAGEPIDPTSLPISAGNMGGTVINPGNPDFRLLQKYIPKLGDALENMRGKVKFTTKRKPIVGEDDEITYGATYPWGEANDPVHKFKYTETEIGPGQDQIERLQTNTHEALHNLYYHLPRLKKNPQIPSESRGDVPNKELAERIMSREQDPVNLDFYAKDPQHGAIDYMAKKIMSRLLFPKGDE